MRFDVRFPIGLLFLAIGLMVAGQGLTGQGSAPLNIDVVWGLVMAAFGAIVLGLALHARRGPPA